MQLQAQTEGDYGEVMEYEYKLEPDTGATKTNAKVSREQVLAYTWDVMTPMQQAAKDLYDAGLNVFPVKEFSKLPFTWKVLITTRLYAPQVLDCFVDKCNIAVMCGRTSHNLVILDCETKLASYKHQIEFNRRKLKPWFVQTPHGFHFYFLSADGELQNVQARDMPMGGNAEIRASGCYCLMPPSKILDGKTGEVLEYSWIYKQGALPPVYTIAQLDWLPLTHYTSKPPATSNNITACLSQRNQDFIESGSEVGERNNRLFACACDMCAHDFDESDATELLLEACYKSGYDTSFTEKQARSTIKSAFSKQRQPATTKRIPTWQRMLSFANDHEWKKMSACGVTVSAQSLKLTFVALCACSKHYITPVFRASERELAELAHLSQPTIHKAIVCLLHHGYIKRASKDNVGTNLFVFNDAICCKNYSLLILDSSSEQILQQTKTDVFTKDGLGDISKRVYQAIEDKDMQPAMIAKQLNIYRSSVTRALAKLQAAGLAKKVGRMWTALPFEDVSKMVVRRVEERTAKRKEQFGNERAKRATGLLLIAKSRWENRNTRPVF